MLLTNRTYFGSEMDDSMRIRRTQILNAITALASVLLKDSVKFIKFDKMMVGIYIYENEDTPEPNSAENDLAPVVISASIEDEVLENTQTDSIDLTVEGTSDMEFTDAISAEDAKCLAKDNISAFCIGDSQMLENQIFTLLRQIAKVFIRKYPPNGLSGYEDTEKYTPFNTDIDKILKDIQYTPIDRLKLGIL